MAPLAEVHPLSGPGTLVVLLVFLVFPCVSLVLLMFPCISEGFQSLCFSTSGSLDSGLTVLTNHVCSDFFFSCPRTSKMGQAGLKRL